MPWTSTNASGALGLLSTLVLRLASVKEVWRFCCWHGLTGAPSAAPRPSSCVSDESTAEVDRALVLLNRLPPGCWRGARRAWWPACSPSSAVAGRGLQTAGTLAAGSIGAATLLGLAIGMWAQWKGDVA